MPVRLYDSVCGFTNMELRYETVMKLFLICISVCMYVCVYEKKRLQCTARKC